MLLVLSFDVRLVGMPSKVYMSLVNIPVGDLRTSCEMSFKA